MDVRLALAGVLMVGYVAYKGYERSGGKLSFRLGAARALPARKPPTPDKLAFERVTLDVTPANLQSFIRLTGNLERLGFRIVADYAIAAWPDTYCRGLVHHDQPVHAAIVERHGLPAHVELFTLFDDLSALVTSSSEEAADPSKPAALRFQQIPGLTLDELFVQHLSSLENLSQDELSPMPATRVAFFEHQRALLVIEHELRKAKRALRTDSLSRALDTLPQLDVQALLKRYGLEEPPEEEPEVAVQESVSTTLPAQEPTEPEEAPKRWGIGSSLLSKRMAAREEAELAPSETVAGTDGGSPVALDLEPAELTSQEAPIAVETVPSDAPEVSVYDLSTEDSDDSDFQVEVLGPLDPEPTPEPPEPEPVAPLPFLVAPEAEAPAPLPFLVGIAAPEPVAPAAEPSARLPFEIVPAGVPDAGTSQPDVVAATPSSRPTCPHCGASLFSSLSSRCSKCKQAVR